VLEKLLSLPVATLKQGNYYIFNHTLAMIVHLFEKRDPTGASAEVKRLVGEISDKVIDYKTLERQEITISAAHKLIYLLLISKDMGYKAV